MLGYRLWQIRRPRGRRLEQVKAIVEEVNDEALPFPSPNQQKVKFALLELGLDCEMIPVDLTKGEQREPALMALNPFGRVPVLVDGDLTL